jgi:hypothetical protein
MKVIGIIFLAFAICTSVYGEEFSVPHIFNDIEDAVDAKTTNENFAVLHDIQASQTAADLEGDWSCISYADWAEGASWLAHDSGIYWVSTPQTVTFVDGAATSDRVLFYDGEENTPFDSRVAEDTLFVKVHRWVCAYNIMKISGTRMRLISLSCINSRFANSVICDRVDPPPEAPVGCYATVDGDNVTLHWASSGGATAYEISWYNTKANAYEVVGTTDNETLSFLTTLPSTNYDHYNYRIFAVNDQGRRGSKVVMVDVPQSAE